MSNNTTGASLSISSARETLLRLAAAEMRHELDGNDMELVRVRRDNESLQEQIRLKSLGSTDTQFLPLPVQDFPNDILLEIFGHVCAIQPDNDNNGMPMTLHLSQVCHRWREIALSNRTLWMTFTLSPSNNQKHVSLLQLYLTRSRGARLLFDVKNPPDENPTEVTLHQQCAVMQRLTAEARRWGDATIDTFDVFFAPNTAVRLDGLKSLSLLHRPTLGGQDREFFISAPQLRTLHILLYSLVSYSTFRLPWNQLENIVFDVQSSIPAVLEALCLCTALRSLTISHSRVLYRHQGTNASIRPFFMCDLPIESLILAGADAYQRFLLPFADAFHCPNLISLTLKDTYASDNTPLVTFLTAVQPPNLLKLDLGNISFSGNAISEVLSSVPLLQELLCSFREQVPLSCLEVSEGLVPQLAVVNFAFWHRPDMDALARAFASRFVGVGLNSMTVAYPAHPSDTELQHITWLREEAGEQYSFKWIDDRPLSTRTLRNPYVRARPPPWLGFSLLKRGWTAQS
ncbi:uncharacterized protein EV420DRAFT_1121085 [Desarmillaria tabescens]|uniref:F-box domain-containing protein n=1 Tax=Armillaria tabescens TaxID=1929756 RepID=A0AA39JEC9_ARMTA|nr:uncharacterized protein EV420DRAFT_1121085 [Desarmillaria tabescens]KAK0441217.1 hypothetical protein EV420DRAFT_1121085 [Desarmillaria tabescens]